MRILFDKAVINEQWFQKSSCDEDPGLKLTVMHWSAHFWHIPLYLIKLPKVKLEQLNRLAICK